MRWRSLMPVPAEELYAWHARPGAFERLLPPWERITVAAREGTFGTDGHRVAFRAHSLGPFKGTWLVELLIRVLVRFVAESPRILKLDVWPRSAVSFLGCGSSC